MTHQFRLPPLSLRVRPDTTKVDMDQLRALYADGLNFTQIGRELGVNRNTVRRALHRHGIIGKPTDGVTARQKIRERRGEA